MSSSSGPSAAEAASGSGAAATAASLALPLLPWAVRDQLLVAELVLKYGAQNWVSWRKGGCARRLSH